MAQKHRENIWRNQLKAELENEDVNRQICSLAVEDMFAEWSTNTRNGNLQERNEPTIMDDPVMEKFTHCCKESSKMFTKSSELQQVWQSQKTGELLYICNVCKKPYNSNDMFTREKKTHDSENSYECLNCAKNCLARQCQKMSSTKDSEM